MTEAQGRPLIEFLGLDDPCPVPRVTSVLICAYRTVSAETFESALSLLSRGNWHCAVRSGDAWIGRARSMVASQWYRQTSEEVFVMVDADIKFEADDLERLAGQCGKGQEIVCADYPVRNGAFLAGKYLGAGRVNERGLVEMEYVPTGCMAVHRSVLDALVDTLPFCHASLPNVAYWPFFIPFMVGDPMTGDNVPLSEDFAFSERARAAGFHAWRDTGVKVGHIAEFILTEDNMAAMHKAAGQS